MARLQRGTVEPPPPLQAQIERRARRPVAPVVEDDELDDTRFTPDNFFSSGSTMLNLALTNHPDCGWQKGRMANIIGDSGAGKTLLALTALAEAANNPEQDDCDLDYDDAENALEFDLASVFGKKMKARTNIIDPPSNNIEQFSDHLALRMRKESPFIYVLDSFDAIGSEADTEHIESERKIRLGESNKKSTGSFGTAKPKLASQMLREDCGTLKRAKGALLIVSQTRDNLTPGSFEKKTRSGGKALKFYAQHELWLILINPIKTKELRIGAECLVKVTKNKVTGKRRNVSFDVYDGYGIDDIGSIIDFLLDEKVWTGGGKSNIDTKGDFGKESISRNKLIDTIDNNKSLYQKLKNIAAEVWNAREDSIKLNRKNKYE